MRYNCEKKKGKEKNSYQIIKRNSDENIKRIYLKLYELQIIVGDCVKALAHMIEEGRQFDYVFGDLTDIPISTTPHGDAWDFIRLILNSSVKVLKPTGKYMTHVSCPD